MKYKVGDRIKFMKDWTLTDGRVMHAKSVWIVNDTSEEHYLLYCVENNLFVMLNYKIVDDNCEKINTAPSITKRINDKHNILNGLLQTDGSVDLERLVSKLENNSVKVTNGLTLENNSAVEHPAHYTDGIECYKYINSHNSSFNAGCIIKYATRYLLKGKPIEDLRKVQQYAEYEIERLKELGYKE